MEIEINQLKVGIHQIRGKIQHTVWTPLQEQEVERRIYSITCIPPDLGALGQTLFGNSFFLEAH